MKPFVVLFLIAAVATSLLLGALYLGQTKLLFPTHLANAARPVLPASAEHLQVTTESGERLVGIRLRGNGRGPLILGFGGNAWSAEGVALTLGAIFPESDTVVFHYRGYGPSGGRPSAHALLADALTIYDDLAPSSPVVAVGFSIGSTVAAHLARHRPLAGLIMVTPFDSLEALVREHFQWAPVALLLRHRMPTLDLVRGIAVPTALIAAARDSIVPARRTDPLRDAVPNLAFDRTIADAGHNDLYGRPDFTLAMREALAATMPPKNLL